METGIASAKQLDYMERYRIECSHRKVKKSIVFLVFTQMMR